MRVWKRLLLLSLPSLVLAVFALELFFRTVIHASAIPFLKYDAEHQLLRYDVNGPRDGVYTLGAWAEQRGRWHINNEGWNANEDYHFEGPRPLVAVVGDSYVEGFQVDLGARVVDLLAADFAPAARLYSFGLSGSPLAQYPAVCRYLEGRFAPDVYVFLLIHNDFSESLERYEKLPNFWRVREEAGGGFSPLPPEPYQVGVKKRYGRHSALVRYLWLNQQLLNGLPSYYSTRRFRAPIAPRDGPDGAAPLVTGVAPATRHLMKQLCDQLAGKPVFFVMDGPRQDIYNGVDLNRSYYYQYNKLIAEICAERNLPFLDLTDEFAAQYKANGIPFNSDLDYHWNEYGHRTAARAIKTFLAEHEVAFSR